MYLQICLMFRFYRKATKFDLIFHLNFTVFTILWLAVHRTRHWWRFRKILWPSQNIWTLPKAEVTFFKKLSQRFSIFYLIDLVEKKLYMNGKILLWIYFPFSFSFFSLASQEEPLRVHVRASNDKLSSERHCSGPPERIGTWGQ